MFDNPRISNALKFGRTPVRRVPAIFSQRSLLLALAPALVLLTGCSEKWAEVSPVSGAVRFDGQVPIGAQIALHPVTALNADAIAVTPTGQVKADGSFVVTSYKAGDGAPPGEYVVTIQWYKIDKEGTVGPNVIPEQYTRPKTSPIKVSVKGGSPTVLEPIAISSAKTAGVARRTY